MHHQDSIIQYPPSAFSPKFSPSIETKDLVSPGRQTFNIQERRYRTHRGLYWTISDGLGFKDKYSLISFFIFGGAMLGFCLSRLTMFSLHAVQHKTTPGEWFWYRKPLYKPNIMAHIVLTTLAGLLSGLQFIPAYQTGSKAIIHRLVGYLVVLMLVPAMITGAIVGHRSFGADVNTQAAFYTLAVLIAGSALLGIYFRKDIPRHRKWMLRSAFYLGTSITARLIKLAAMQIITNMGTFYAVWSCEEIAFVLGETALKRAFPQCTAPTIMTAVKASTKGNLVNYGSTVRCTFGMALWVALVIHAIGVEIYILSTETTVPAYGFGTRI